MLKSVAIIALAMSMAVAAQEPPPARADVPVLPEDLARRCAEEGGCRLFTRLAIETMIRHAQIKALLDGFRQGFQQGTEQACRRGDV